MTNTLTKEILINDPRYIVPVSFDILFKELFGKEENADITAFLISALLDIPYHDVKGKIKFKGTTVNKNTVNSKHGEKDVSNYINFDLPYVENIINEHRNLKSKSK